METMKDLLRESLMRAVALYATAAIFPGLKVSTVAFNLILSGLVFTLFNRLVKPIVKLITLPFNLLTLGLFNWANNVIVLAILVKFWTHVSVVAFSFPAWQQAGFSVPSLYVNILVSYIVAAILLTFIYKLLDWLCEY
jgi:putative membrane protein